MYVCIYRYEIIFMSFVAAFFCAARNFFLSNEPDKFPRQAVGLLDDLDKELNNFAMRLREWCAGSEPRDLVRLG